MELIGRKKECEELNELLRLNQPQFVATTWSIFAR